MGAETVPPEVLAWAAAATAAADAGAGGRLRAAYLHGSAVLGGWSGHSDVDLLLVLADDAGEPAAAAAGDALAATAVRCPGAGLEASIVSVAQVRSAAAPWPFLVHVNTVDQPPRIVSGAGHPGDPDLLMHYVVCRAAGVAVAGPSADALIGAVPRPVVLRYLADEMRWGLEYGAERYSVLNACRALCYLTDSRVVSKLAGGEDALRRGCGPAEVIERALAAQRAGSPGADPAASEAAAFVRAVAAKLATAAEGAAGGGS